MEREPTTPLVWQCEACEVNYELDDHTAKLFLFTLAPRYSFVQFQCPDKDCGNVMNYFADNDAMDEMALHLTEIYPLDEVPDWVVEGYDEFMGTDGERVIEVVGRLALEESWAYFWKQYDPMPFEFKC